MTKETDWHVAMGLLKGMLARASFSGRQDIFRRIQLHVAVRLGLESTPAWPDVLVFLEPDDVMMACKEWMER